MISRKTFALVASLLLFAGFAGFNVAAHRWLAPVRADLTAAQLYTLSGSTRRVLAGLVEPVRIELVYSRSAGAEFPDIRAHAERIREMLNEVSARGGGKLVVQETDPEPFSAEEDRIAIAGLTPVRSAGGDSLYLGLIGRNSIDDEIVIPFLSPDRDAFLEYDLTRLIAQLDDPDPPVIALLSTMPGFQGDGSGQGDAFILREMARSFRIQPISDDFVTLPADTDVLMLMHPPTLNDWQQYVVDQFLLRNGRALIAVDPASIVMAGARRTPTASALGHLSQTLGVELSADVTADETLALPVEVDAGAGRRNILAQPLFLAAPRELMARDDPVTGDLTRVVNLGAAGSLSGSETRDHEFTPLLETTENAAGLQPDFALGRPDPRAVIAAMTGPRGVRVLAARISGSLATAFPEGAPDPVLPSDPALSSMLRDDIANMPSRATTSEDRASVIVLADVDLFADSLHLNPADGTPIADNAAFVLNALDNLAGGRALSDLRSRAPALRPMSRIEAMRDTANARLAEQQEALEARLTDLETRLKERETAQRASLSGLRTALTEEDPELSALQDEILATRSSLREIERDYRSEIDAMEQTLVALNVWLAPILAAFAGLGVFAWRNRRRRRAP